MSETLNSSVRKYNSANESQQKLSGGCDYYRVTVNSGHRIAGSNVSDALYRISGVFPNNNAQLLNGSWEVFCEHFFLGVNETTNDNQGIRVCLPDLVNVGKDFATQIGSKIQPGAMPLTRISGLKSFAKALVIIAALALAIQ